MRKNVLAGLVLAATTTGLVILGSVLDLELQPVALLGVAIGAVLVLVSDHTPAGRLGGFAAGLVVAWFGYLVRAQLLPDTDGGRAVFAGIVVLLGVGVVVVVRDRLPLWAVLLGSAAFAGAFEAGYTAEPPLVLAHSMSAATALLMAAGAGFLVTSLVAPAGPAGSGQLLGHAEHADDEHLAVTR